MSKTFSEEDDHIILNMREVQHASWYSIGKKLDRPPNVCASRYHNLSEGRTKEPIKSIAEIENDKYGGVLRDLLAERESRHAAKIARDEEDALRGILTASFNGDPEPGRSALDKRRASA